MGGVTRCHAVPQLFADHPHDRENERARTCLDIKIIYSLFYSITYLLLLFLLLSHSYIAVYGHPWLSTFSYYVGKGYIGRVASPELGNFCVVSNLL